MAITTGGNKFTEEKANQLKFLLKSKDPNLVHKIMIKDSCEKVYAIHTPGLMLQPQVIYGMDYEKIALITYDRNQMENPDHQIYEFDGDFVKRNTPQRVIEI